MTRRSTLVADGVMALGVLIGSLALATARGLPGEARLSHSTGAAGDPVGVVLLVLAALPLLAWRRSPQAAFVLSAGASIALAALDYPSGFPLGPTVGLYLLARSRSEESMWTKEAIAGVLALLVGYLAATAAADGAFPALALTHTSLAWAVAWFAGERTRLRKQQLADLRERAGRAVRDAERERLLAVAEERARIARDLHDSAGHAINVIAVRAGAARLRHAQEPDRALAVLAAVEELARDTVAEIDQIVGVLREHPSDPDQVEPPPGLASLAGLVADQNTSGLEVTLENVGRPRPLSVAGDQAAYRITQEALTNAARHGCGPARVRVVFGPNGVDLDVTNPVGETNGTRRGGGHGLIGMQERAVLLGGSLTVQRRDGQFFLAAHIPYAGARR